MIKEHPGGFLEGGEHRRSEKNRELTDESSQEGKISRSRPEEGTSASEAVQKDSSLRAEKQERVSMKFHRFLSPFKKKEKRDARIAALRRHRGEKKGTTPAGSVLPNGAPIIFMGREKVYTEKRAATWSTKSRLSREKKSRLSPRGERLHSLRLEIGG